MINILTATAGTTAGYDWASLDLSVVTNSFFSAVPIVIPVVLGFVAFRKGYSFIMGQIRR